MLSHCASAASNHEIPELHEPYKGISIRNLPTEILLQVFINLPLTTPSLRHAFLTCHAWNHLLNDAVFVKTHILQQLRTHGVGQLDSCDPWQELPLIYRSAALLYALINARTETIRIKQLAENKRPLFGPLHLSNSMAIKCTQICIKYDPKTLQKVNPDALEKWAITTGSTSLLLLLFTGPTLVLKPSQKLFNQCCLRGYLQVVQTMLAENHIDPSYNGSESLRSSTAFNHFKIVQLLLKDRRVDPRERNSDKFLFVTACLSSKSDGGVLAVETVKMLLGDERVNPYDTDRVLMAATVSGRVEILELFLRDARDIPRMDLFECLQYAVSASQDLTDIVKMLLEDGRVCLTSDMVLTVKLESVFLLLIKDFRAAVALHEMTLLKLACTKGFEKGVEYLLQKLQGWYFSKGFYRYCLRAAQRHRFHQIEFLLTTSWRTRIKGMHSVVLEENENDGGNVLKSLFTV